MISQWLSWLNCALLGLVLLLVLSSAFFWLKRSSEIVCSDPPCKKHDLPKGAFVLLEQAYENIGEPLLSIEQTPPAMQLPDLRQQLVYYGKNGRPDAMSTHTLLHFSLGGTKSIASIRPEEKLYLVYDRKSAPGRYTFSPQNEKTSLWIQAIQHENEAQIEVTLENDRGEIVLEPENFAQFTLSEKEFARYAGTNWEIGSFRVDGTILARQKARWYGVDRFLEQHGGEDFQNNTGKQRIDFGESDDLYSAFVKLGDCLIWDQNRWKVVTPGDESLGHPLLVVKKIDERLMAFELWDIEGKGKVLLNLLKTTEPWIVQNSQSLQHMFKFVGAKTRTQCVFEISGKRVVLRPSDWLLLTTKGWIKLSTEEEIDNYVKRKLSGTLFVFESIERKDERQIMLGKLFSPARNEYHTIELPLQAKSHKATSSKENKEIGPSDHVSLSRDADLMKHVISPTSLQYSAPK